MVSYININEITPASYNPRIIQETQLIKLQQSIKELGFILPIIINGKDLHYVSPFFVGGDIA